jgi:hypothetical protein
MFRRMWNTALVMFPQSPSQVFSNAGIPGSALDTLKNVNVEEIHNGMPSRSSERPRCSVIAGPLSLGFRLRLATARRDSAAVFALR